MTMRPGQHTHLGIDNGTLVLLIEYLLKSVERSVVLSWLSIALAYHLKDIITPV